MIAQKIKLTEIISNQGQIEGLPKNPRVLRNEQFERLKKSIQVNPSMLELRELLVVPHDNRYIVIAGNMRLRAMQELKFDHAPCKVIDPETAPDKLRAYTILDNAQFGEWDWDDLANEWDAGELDAWGIDTVKVQDYSDKNQEIDVSEYSDFMVIKLEYTEEDYHDVKNKLSEIAPTPAEAVKILLNNET